MHISLTSHIGVFKNAKVNCKEFLLCESLPKTLFKTIWKGFRFITEWPKYRQLVLLEMAWNIRDFFM